MESRRRGAKKEGEREREREGVMGLGRGLYSDRGSGDVIAVDNTKKHTRQNYKRSRNLSGLVTGHICMGDP
jgi:hypothetical protein